MLSCFSHVQLFMTLWTIACQASLSVGFSQQEYRSGLPCPPPGDLSDPGIKLTSPVSPVLQADSLPTEPLGSPIYSHLNFSVLLELFSTTDIYCFNDIKQCNSFTGKTGKEPVWFILAARREGGCWKRLLAPWGLPPEGGKNLQGRGRVKAAFRSGCTKLGLKEKKTPRVRFFAPPHSEAARCGDHSGVWGSWWMPQQRPWLLTQWPAKHWLGLGTGYTVAIWLSHPRGMELSLSHRTGSRTEWAHVT